MDFEIAELSGAVPFGAGPDEVEVGLAVEGRVADSAAAVAASLADWAWVAVTPSDLDNPRFAVSGPLEIAAWEQAEAQIAVPASGP